MLAVTQKRIKSRCEVYLKVSQRHPYASIFFKSMIVFLMFTNKVWIFFLNQARQMEQFLNPSVYLMYPSGEESIEIL